MKHKTRIFAFLALTGLALGCNKEQTTSQQMEPVRTDTMTTARDLKDYTFAQKAEFTEKMRSQLAEINKDMDALTAKIEKSDDAIKAEAKPRLEALRDQAAKLNVSLDEVGNATESTWETFKSGTRNAYDALAESFQQSREWLSEKIAP